MRVVMLTDDVQIDRRILQEAETLIDDGHEVILLAGGVDAPFSYERLSRVKVERIVPAVDGARERLIWRAGEPVLAALAAMRGRASRAGRLRRIAPALGVLERAVRVLTSQVVRAVRLTRRIPYRDAVLADRASYYRPDVVHAHDLPQLRAAAVVARRRRIPLIYDAHELYPEIMSLRPRLRRRLRRLERRLISGCDAVITVNPYLADEIARRYDIPPPTVILNAAQPAAGDRGPDPLRESIGASAATPIVLYQGWLSHQRGLTALVDAFTHVALPARLVLLGYGDAGPDVAARAEALGVGDRVHVLPAVAQHELAAWTRTADVGVIPYPDVDLNHRFSSPNKLYEFIQAGVPVVANDLPYLRDVVAGEGIGFVADIADARAFGKAIETAISEKSRQALVDRIRDVAPRYDWPSQEPALRELYARVATAARR